MVAAGNRDEFTVGFFASADVKSGTNLSLDGGSVVSDCGNMAVCDPDTAFFAQAMIQDFYADMKTKYLYLVLAFCRCSCFIWASVWDHRCHLVADSKTCQHQLTLTTHFFLISNGPVCSTNSNKLSF